MKTTLLPILAHGLCEVVIETTLLPILAHGLCECVYLWRGGKELAESGCTSACVFGALLGGYCWGGIVGGVHCGRCERAVPAFHTF
jgi:hypothetical protein